MQAAAASDRRRSGCTGAAQSVGAVVRGPAARGPARPCPGRQIARAQLAHMPPSSNAPLGTGWGRPAKASALPASNSWFQRNPDLRCDRRAPLRSGRASAPAGAPMCRRKAPLKMEVGLCRPGLTSSEPEDVLEPARPGRAARARTHRHLCCEATIIARGAARISAPRSASAYPGTVALTAGSRVKMLVPAGWRRRLGPGRPADGPDPEGPGPEPAGGRAAQHRRVPGPGACRGSVRLPGGRRHHRCQTRGQRHNRCAAAATGIAIA